MEQFRLIATKNPNVFREVDANGNWKRYFIKHKNVYLDSVNAILDEGFYHGSGLENWKLRTPVEEQKQILRAAGRKGRNVHKTIECILDTYRAGHIGTFDLSSIPLTYLEKQGVISWARFWNDHNPILIAYEEPVWNLQERYAGTLDEILILTRECGAKACSCHSVIGKVGLWDKKTSKRFRPAYGAQNAAYANGDNIPDFFPGENPFRQLIEYTGIVRLGVGGTRNYETRIQKNAAMISSLKRFHEAQGTKAALQPLTAQDASKIKFMEQFRYR